jgi:hypothetical protein
MVLQYVTPHGFSGFRLYTVSVTNRYTYTLHLHGTVRVGIRIHRTVQVQYWQSAYIVLAYKYCIRSRQLPILNGQQPGHATARHRTAHGHATPQCIDHTVSGPATTHTGATAPGMRIWMGLALHGRRIAQMYKKYRTIRLTHIRRGRVRV